MVNNEHHYTENSAKVRQAWILRFSKTIHDHTVLKANLHGWPQYIEKFERAEMFAKVFRFSSSHKNIRKNQFNVAHIRHKNESHRKRVLSM